MQEYSLYPRTILYRGTLDTQIAFALQMVKPWVAFSRYICKCLSKRLSSMDSYMYNYNRNLLPWSSAAKLFVLHILVGDVTLLPYFSRIVSGCRIVFNTDFNTVILILFLVYSTLFDHFDFK